MAKLHLLVEVRDFDLERIGFSVSVVEPLTGRKQSESYLQMTLPEFETYVRALKAAKGEIETNVPDAYNRRPAASRPPLPNGGHDVGARPFEVETLPKLPIKPTEPPRQ